MGSKNVFLYRPHGAVLGNHYKGKLATLLQCLTKPYTVLPTPWRKEHATFPLKVCCHQIAPWSLCPQVNMHNFHDETSLQHRLVVFIPSGHKGPCTAKTPSLGVRRCYHPEVLHNCWTQAISFSFCSRPVNYVLGLVHSAMSFLEAETVYYSLKLFLVSREVSWY